MRESLSHGRGNNSKFSYLTFLSSYEAAKQSGLDFKLFMSLDMS
jgi:hypothetical protein